MYSMKDQLPEPWLRGQIVGLPAIATQLLYSFRQAEEDLERFTEGLDNEQLWATPHKLASVGTQVRHIIGSIDRLLSYAEGKSLSVEQLQELRSENDPIGGREVLMENLRRAFGDAEQRVRSIDSSSYEEARQVGRNKLPTTAGALLVHIAEHTQRHVGQAIVTAKIVRG
jgi:uncharacterized damage-inducible protein DinB